MPDPFKLLELPLYSIIAILFFYLVTEMIKWSQARWKERQTEIASIAHLDYYTSFNHGSHVNAYFALEALIEHYQRKADTDGQETIPTKEKVGLVFVGNSVRYIYELGQKTVEAKQTFGDFSTSPSHIDPSKISHSLLHFKKPRAGLALFFLEQNSIFYAEVDEWNQVNDKEITYKQAVDQLIGIRRTLMTAILVGAALQCKALRNRIAKGLFYRNALKTRVEKNAVLQDEFDKLIAQKKPTKNNDAEGAAKNEDNREENLEMIAIGAIPGAKNDFMPEAFDVMLIDLAPNNEWRWYVVPGFLTAIFFAVALTDDSLRQSIFGEDPTPSSPTVTCERTFGQDNVLRWTKCTQTMPSEDLEFKNNVVQMKSVETTP